MPNFGTRARRVLQSRTRVIPVLPFVIPLFLLPLAAGWWCRAAAPAQFAAYRETIFLSYLIYIAVVRFALLDMALFYVSRNCRSVHLDLLQIVFLYLEITAVTVLFFALLYELFGVFDLFRYNGIAAVQQVQAMQGHSLHLAIYISVELFTTLGLGDWIPQTHNAMLAVEIEAILGFIQAGVFFAVLIYAHQDLKSGENNS